MTADTVSAPGQLWLAGNPGPPPPPASVWFGVVVLALVFGSFAFVAWSRRRGEKPLRKEIRARPVTLRVRVEVLAAPFGKTMLAQGGPLFLDMHGDAFQVSHPFPLAWFPFGQDYCYRAQDTTVEMVRDRYHSDWIEINGQPAGSAARIQIRRRKMNRQLWDVLVSAGAHPIGSPPAP